MNEERREGKPVCVILAPEDVEAVRLITDFLAQQMWIPHMKSSAAAIRYSLRRTVATLATEIQAADKRRRTLRRQKRQTAQVRKG